MSLVSDALKKAQREAAAREARDKGLAPPPEPRSPLHPFRRRRPRRAAALAAAAGLFALAGGGLFFWFRDSGAPGAPRSAATAAPGAVLPVMGEAGSEGSGTARDAPEPTPAPRVGPSPNAEPATPARPSPNAPVPAPPSRVPSQDERTAGAPPGTANAPGGGAGEKESPGSAGAGEAPAPWRFVREAELPDGARLRVGGIAYSEVAPLAYLNGKLLGVGESVEGWTVRAIGRGEVELGRGDERLILTLR